MYLLAFAESIQLFPDGTIFVHIAIVLAMIWVLNRTLYKPINRVIAAREKSKGGQSSEAESILKDVSDKETRYSKEMLDARSKGYELVEQEHRAATAEREQILTAAKAEASNTFESGKSQLEKQASEARAAIASDAEKIADSIAANILKA